MLRPELVIFDCDGVLVDSEPISNRIMVEMLNAEGFPLTVEESFRDFVGMSLQACWKKIEARFGRPIAADFEERLRERTHAALSERVMAIPGVEDVLDRLILAGVQICVASSGPPEKINLTLGKVGLIDRFQGHLFSAIQVSRGKPHPDLFEFAAYSMRVPVTRCVVVEDAIPGVLGARAAGMRVLAYGAAPHANRLGLVNAGGELFEDMAELCPRLGFQS